MRRNNVLLFIPVNLLFSKAFCLSKPDLGLCPKNPAKAGFAFANQSKCDLQR